MLDWYVHVCAGKDYDDSEAALWQKQGTARSSMAFGLMERISQSPSAEGTLEEEEVARNATANAYAGMYVS